MDENSTGSPTLDRASEHPQVATDDSPDSASPCQDVDHAANGMAKLSLDLDDAFSTGDDEPGTFNLTPVSLHGFASSERHAEFDEVEEGDEGMVDVHLDAVNGVSPKTPTPAHFMVDSEGAAMQSADTDTHPVHSDHPSSPTSVPAFSPSTDLQRLSPILTHDAPPNVSRGNFFRAVDQSSEFVDVSLTPTLEPASREESPVPLTASETASSMGTATSGSFLTRAISRDTDTSTEYASPDLTTAPVPPSNGTSPKSPTQPVARGSRRKGPSALETVISKTRPTYLPPKPKSEDLKHLKDWSSMMQQAKASEERRKQEAELRKAVKEHKMEESLETWEREVMPDIPAAMRDKKLRRLWYSGVPPKLRGRVWAVTVGNPLALSKDAYRPCLARARRALSAGSFSRQTLDVIDEDVNNTLPSLRLFDPEHGPMHQDLKDFLYAWTVSRGDEGLTYVRGASHVAAMFLINMPTEQAFMAYRNLLDRHCLRSFYAGQNDDIEAYYRIFDTLLADTMPKVYYNFQKHRVPPTRYLPNWFVPLFLLHLPFDACARIWDIMLLEGDSFLFRAALGVLGVMEGRLYFPDHEELMQVLRGDDGSAGKGKEKERPLREGGPYEQYGMTEEALFERISALDEWWKENTWWRLIQRELPDL